MDDVDMVSKNLKEAWETGETVTTLKAAASLRCAASPFPGILREICRMLPLALP